MPYCCLTLRIFISREIATVTYRSGEEWDGRFGRDRIDPEAEPSLCPYFMIENYLDHQGEMFSTKYDPNSLLYISKVRCYENTCIYHVIYIERVYGLRS